MPDIKIDMNNEIIQVLRLGRFGAAESMAVEALKKNPLDAQAYLNLAETLMLQGYGLSAKSFYDRAWLMDPQAGWVQNVYTRLNGICQSEQRHDMKALLVVPPVTVAAALIVRDEEDAMPRWLESIEMAVDEIVIVDTGSSDRTVDIVSAHPRVKLVRFPWCDDFASARNAALPHIASDWVLWMDADETLEKEDIEAVKEAAGLYTRPGICAILSVWRKNRISGKNHDFFDEPRMFPTGFGLRYKGRVHEQIILGEKRDGVRYIRRPVRIRFHHHGYEPSVMEEKKKSERNVRLLEKMIAEEPENKTAWFFYGRDTLSAGDTDNGIQRLLHAEKLAQETPKLNRLAELRLLLADAYMSKGEYGKALEVYGRALEEDPYYPDARLAMAKAQTVAAVEMLKAAGKNVRLAKEYIPGYRGRFLSAAGEAELKADLLQADIFRLTGSLTAALELYWKSIAKMNDTEPIKNEIERIYREYRCLYEYVEERKDR